MAGAETQSSLMVTSAVAGAARSTARQFTPGSGAMTQLRWRIGEEDLGFPQSHIPRHKPQEPGLALPQGASLQGPSGEKCRKNTSVGKEEGTSKPAYIAGGHVKWSSYYGKVWR